MFILLSGYLDDTARRGAGGERKAPCKQREKSTLLYVSPCRVHDAPTTAREWCLPFHGFLANFGARRFPKGERKALWCARRRIPSAPLGIDAPTTARTVGLPP